MNKLEFQDLLAELCATFPAIARQFDAAKDKRTSLALTWHGVLEHCQASDAKAAVQRIVAGQEQEPAKYSEHKWPAHLAGICRRLASERRPKRQYAEGEPTYRCLICKDSGIVTIYARDCVLQAERGEFDASRVPQESVVLCDCSQWSVGKSEIQTLKRGRDVQVNPMTDCAARGKYLVENVQARRLQDATFAPNYEPGFDAFNTGEAAP